MTPGNASTELLAESVDIPSLSPAHPAHQDPDIPDAADVPETTPLAPQGQVAEPETQYRIETLTGYEIEIRIGDRLYQLTDFNLRKLNDLAVTLKLSGKSPEGFDNFYISEVNLARAKSRNEFIEDLRESLQFGDETIRQDLQVLTLAIEKLQRDNIEALEEDKTSMVKVFTYSKDEEKEALEYLKHNDPLERELFQDLEVLGYSGDDLAKIVLYVAVTSRKLDKPLSVLSVANSSAGKSFGQEVISSLVPDDELFSYTRLSPRSLSHFGKYDLQNKALFLDEFVGSEDESSSQLRSLLSRGHITTGYSTMDSMTGKVQTINKDVFGPIALLSSATNENRIDDETRSRFMILPVDESQEQTARVMASMIERNTERGVLSQGQRDKIRRKYQMFQKVLRPVTVVLPDPWANKIQFNSERISQKRRFQGYLSFLYAVALHRQFQKDVKVLMTPSNEKVEVIVVDRRDILLTNSVMSRLYGAGSQDLNPVNRKMLLDIQAFCDVQGKQAGIPPGEITFTRRDIRESGRWDAVPCRRAFEKLLELEYIEKSFGHKRARHFYRLAPGNSPGNSGDSGSALWCPE